MNGDTAPHVVEDVPGILQLLSDGSVVRGDESVLWPKDPLPDVPGVQWKDVMYHAAHGLSVRVYRPASSSPVSGSSKLPAVVLSVQYRLAPEHRLPAAIEDGADFLCWLRSQADRAGSGSGDPWLVELADFARTFISGSSAGANLAHHVTVHAASTQTQRGIYPLRVAGYVLLSVFLGGSDRTAVEANPPAGITLTVEGSDKLWRMSLPVGASRDNPAGQPVRPREPQPPPAPVAALRLSPPPVPVAAPSAGASRRSVAPVPSTCSRRNPKFQ